jgi:hypothetical protein
MPGADRKDTLMTSEPVPAVDVDSAERGLLITVLLMVLAGVAAMLMVTG